MQNQRKEAWKILSENTRLSESAVFSQARDFYISQGTETWKKSITPSFITSNCYISKSYSEIIFSYILDHLENHDVAYFEESPICIIEMCAGHGKMAFYIVKNLIDMLVSHDLPANIFKYILTDISQKNLESWRKHPALRTYIVSGTIDFGLFDVENDENIKLCNSGKVLKKHSINSPVVLIGNYALDTLSHDAFQIKNSKLYEQAVTVQWTPQENQLAGLEYEYTSNEISANYYEENEINDVLNQYTQIFSDVSFLIPTGGLKAIDTVQSLTKYDTLVLLGDKGYSNIKSFPGPRVPHIAEHGSISFMVNFDAISRLFALKNGFSYLPDESLGNFHTGVFCTGSINDYKYLPITIKNNLSNFNPESFFQLQKAKENLYLKGCFKQIIGLIQLSHYDPYIFFCLAGRLIEILQGLSSQEKMTLEKVMKKVKHNYFELEENLKVIQKIYEIQKLIDEKLPFQI